MNLFAWPYVTFLRYFWENMMHVSAMKLCLITHPKHLVLDHADKIIFDAIQGGVTSVQLRYKGNPSKLRQMALNLMALLRPLHIPLIINDNVQFAKDINADGVHLGQSDLSPIEARHMLGEHKIIGWSIETMEQLEQANQWSCIDYIAASAIFQSKSKTDCKTLWGLAGLKKITQMTHHPVVAVGGIHQGNVGDIMRHGAIGAALISEIYDHPNPEHAARVLIHEIDRGMRDVSNN